jgi:hypothetical protein
MTKPSGEPKYYRVRGLCERYGLSKGLVINALRHGALRGKKVGGILLISAESVNALLENAEPWRTSKPADPGR